MRYHATASKHRSPSDVLPVLLLLLTWCMQIYRHATGGDFHPKLVPVLYHSRLCSRRSVALLPISRFDNSCLYEGELFDYIKKSGRIDEHAAQQGMKRLVEAIDHVHSLGVIHRDIKPEKCVANHNPLEMIVLTSACLVCFWRSRRIQHRLYCQTLTWL